MGSFDMRPVFAFLLAIGIAMGLGISCGAGRYKDHGCGGYKVGCVPAGAAELEPCDTTPAGAREGEDVDARIARLETQLRLSKAERTVNRPRHR